MQPLPPAPDQCPPCTWGAWPAHRLAPTSVPTSVHTLQTQYHLQRRSISGPRLSSEQLIGADLGSPSALRPPPPSPPALISTDLGSPGQR